VIKAGSSPKTTAVSGRTPGIGTTGRLAIFIWSLALVLVSPADRLFPAAGLALLANAFLHPPAVKRLLSWRWLVFAVLLVLPSMLWGNEADLMILGLPVSSAGLAAGLQMVLRALTVILAVDGFSATVNIAEVAGLLERIGFPGLGFSIGVAMNLLPALRKSSQNTWRSLQMRGGLRRQRWRGLQLLLVTVVANALRRAEEIALAAEVRGFSPERSRAMAIRVGSFDPYIAVGLLFLWLALVFVI
jgi:energy-coupling factor transporter transmembrane protein EcfT